MRIIFRKLYALFAKHNLSSGQTIQVFVKRLYTNFTVLDIKLIFRLEKNIVALFIHDNEY